MELILSSTCTHLCAMGGGLCAVPFKQVTAKRNFPAFPDEALAFLN
jgi:hypothetical protein